MKVYFAGSIRVGRNDKLTYLQLISHLKKFGEVLSEHIGSQKLTNSGEKISAREIYKRNIQLIASSDVFVAEVSTPSLGVGHEIGIAKHLGKKILCLHKSEISERVSAMIKGDSSLTVKGYENLDQALKLIDEFLK